MSRRNPKPVKTRYELLVKVASGGMATVYVGRRTDGDPRLWAIKRAHAHLVEEREFRSMFIEEANVASRIHHPNIVAVHDVEDLNGELRLVMDYVEGGSLAELNAVEEPLPPALAVRIVLDTAAGLHAAHGMRDDRGVPLALVHRDVSPHNILIGVDGVSRLADFGIAKCAMSNNSTTTGALKGKLGYMSPEYIGGMAPDQRHDVFALGVVLWEALAHRRLFKASNEVETMKRVAAAEVPPISQIVPHIGTELDAVIAMALARNRDDRFENAQAVGAALEIAAKRSNLSGTHAEVATYLQRALHSRLQKRRDAIAELLVPSTSKDGVQTATSPVVAAPTVATGATPMPPEASGFGHEGLGGKGKGKGSTTPMAESPLKPPVRPSATLVSAGAGEEIRPRRRRDPAALVTEGVVAGVRGHDETSGAVPRGVPRRGAGKLWLFGAGFMIVGGVAAALVTQGSGAAPDATRPDPGEGAGRAGTPSASAPSPEVIPLAPASAEASASSPGPVVTPSATVGLPGGASPRPGLAPTVAPVPPAGPGSTTSGSTAPGSAGPGALVTDEPPRTDDRVAPNPY